MISIKLSVCTFKPKSFWTCPKINIIASGSTKLSVTGGLCRLFVSLGSEYFLLLKKNTELTKKNPY